MWKNALSRDLIQRAWDNRGPRATAQDRALKLLNVKPSQLGPKASDPSWSGKMRRILQGASPAAHPDITSPSIFQKHPYLTGAAALLGTLGLGYGAHKLLSRKKTEEPMKKTSSQIANTVLWKLAQGQAPSAVMPQGGDPNNVGPQMQQQPQQPQMQQPPEELQQMLAQLPPEQQIQVLKQIYPNLPDIQHGTMPDGTPYYYNK